MLFFLAQQHNPAAYAKRLGEVDDQTDKGEARSWTDQFVIGGTQHNGTKMLRPDTSWFRVDFGDGGIALIDQNAVDITNARMFHTYFNQANAMGYARVTNVANAVDNGWTFLAAVLADQHPMA